MGRCTDIGMPPTDANNSIELGFSRMNMFGSGAQVTEYDPI